MGVALTWAGSDFNSDVGRRTACGTDRQHFLKKPHWRYDSVSEGAEQHRTKNKGCLSSIQATLQVCFQKRFHSDCRRCLFKYAYIGL